jgi:hypothetical protein
VHIRIVGKKRRKSIRNSVNNSLGEPPANSKPKKRSTGCKYVKHQKVLLKTHAEFTENWIQDCISNDPSVLGMGELILKDKERNQPGAGRLDLLFQDPDTNLRYEIEIQLGNTDESHTLPENIYL